MKTRNSGDMNPSKENSSGKKIKVRCVAKLKKLTEKTDGERLKVYYNSKGYPVGSIREDFASYRGLLARKMVKITYAN